MRRLRHDTSGRVLAGLIVTMALLVPLAVFGAPALAHPGSSASQYQYSGSAQLQYGKGKITICHFTHSKKHPYHTIRVSMAGWLHGHSKHARDHTGRCNGDELRVWKLKLAKKLKHANKGHGKGHENGQGQNENGQGKGHANGHAKKGNDD